MYRLRSALMAVAMVLTAGGAAFGATGMVKHLNLNLNLGQQPAVEAAQPSDGVGPAILEGENDHRPDISITKTRMANGSYVLSVTNNGAPIPARVKIEVVDIVPSGMQITAIAAGPWSCTPLPIVTGPDAVTCTLISNTAPIPTGPLPAITLTAQGKSTCPNCARARLYRADDPKDEDWNIIQEAAMDNNAVCETTDTTIDLGVEKRRIGDGRYQVLVTNRGGPLAGPVRVDLDELVPSGMTVTALAAGPWVCTPTPPPSVVGPDVIRCSLTISSGVLNTGPLPPLEVITTGGRADCPNCVRVRLFQAKGRSPNSVKALEWRELRDVDLSNNGACAPAGGSVPKIDLALGKTGEPFTDMTGPAPRKGFKYTLDVSNPGDAFTATGAIRVTDPVPAGMVFTAASGTGWDCTANSFPIAAGGTLACVYTGSSSIAQGAHLPPLVITALAVDPKGDIENCATVGLATNSGLAEKNLENNHACTGSVFDHHDDPPPFAAQCGMDVLFVVDASASIRDPNNDGSPGDSQTNTVISALSAAGRSFIGSDARVIFFGTDAAIAPWGAWHTLTNSNYSGLSSGYDPGNMAPPVGSFTNWEAALKLAKAEAIAHPGPELIIFITDGRPTYYLDDGSGLPTAAPISPAGEVLATNQAIHYVNDIYGSAIGDKIIGIGVGPAFATSAPSPNGLDHLHGLLGGPPPVVASGGNFNAVTDTVVVSDGFSALGGVLADIGTDVCPDILLRKSGFGLAVSPGGGPYTGQMTLTAVNRTSSTLTNVVVRDVLPAKLINPTAFSQTGVTTATVSGRREILWTIPSLAPKGTAGDSQTLSFTAQIDPAWVAAVDASFPTPTSGGTAYRYEQVMNYAQVQGIGGPSGLAIGSTPGNMASIDGPLHEQDEDSAQVWIQMAKACVGTACGGGTAGTYLYVDKIRTTSGEGCTAGQPCTFNVTVTGTHHGPVAFGDGVFSGFHSSLTTTSTPISAAFPALAPVSGTTLTDPICNLSSSGGAFYCYFPSVPGTGLYTLNYKITVTAPSAPGQYTNCFFALPWTGAAPTNFGAVYGAGITGGVPHWTYPNPRGDCESFTVG